MLAEACGPADHGSEGEPQAPSWPALRALRRRWAELLRRIFEVHPLACPRCGDAMRIVAFILERDAITAISKHPRRSGRDPSALPERATS